jgi:predicted DNA-binding protein
MAMKRTQIYLPKEIHEWLQKEAARKGTSMAELIRQIIEEKTERKPK